MLPNFLQPIHNERKASERSAGPHRLALAAAAAAPALGDGATAPRSPSSRLPAAATSPRIVAGSLNGSSRAAALPAFRSLLGGRAAPSAAAPQPLPHVRHAAEPAPPAYTNLDCLRKITELHKGKHSTVHSYMDVRTGQLVAVKAYHKHTMAKRHYRNVRREVAIGRLLARQRFTGTVLLLGAFEDDSHIYLVQESCQGGDLYCRMMRAPGRMLLEADVCRDVVVPLLLTLTFLHANHIVHRDIKPENLFFTADGGLRLGDFGLSIDTHKERPTSRVGTLDYMAPEVVGMLSPDEIQQRGLAPHQIGHYDCKVDVWAVGVLTYELICGQPPFEVECLKQTERNIKYSEVEFPAHVSQSCRSFIQQALTKRPESRPSAAQLFQHAWAQAHYQQLLAGQQRQIAAAAAAAAALSSTALACTPELRRTVSQPPSPSKSMPEDAVAAGRQAGGSGTSTPAAPAALAPFLPLSQAKMAHKVRLLSPGRPPNSSRAAGWRRRRLSDPLARMPELPAAAHAEEGEAAAAAEAGAAAAEQEAPPRTPEAAYAPAAVSDGTGAAAAVISGDDTASTSMAQCFETPGTPGLKTTPLGRQRPAVLQTRCGQLGRSPFLLAATAGGASSGSSANSAASGESLPQPRLRKVSSPKRSRFAAAGTAAAAAAAAENDEMHAAEALGSPDLLGPRSTSLSALALAKDGSSGSLNLAARSCSFTSFGGGSSGNLQLAARASSFTSFGGSSSNLSNIAGSRPPSRQQLEGLDQQQHQLAGGLGGVVGAGEAAAPAAAAALQ